MDSASSGQGATAAAGQLAHHLIGRNPKTWAVIIIAMVVVLIIFMVLYFVTVSKLKDCESGAKGGMLGTNPLGNLNTGSNNPMWQNQMGDAGWGGSMHSTYQDGQSRVWGASAEGGHDMVVAPHAVKNCSGANCVGAPRVPCAVSPAAVGEAQALTAAQAFEPAAESSAKNMNDDALVRVMNGGGM